MLLILFFLYACSSSSQQTEKEEAAAPVSVGSNYRIEKIYEGPNKYTPVAVILNTDEVLEAPMLSAIKKAIISDPNLNKAYLRSAPFFAQHDGKTYGVLCNYHTREVQKDFYVSMDSLQYYANLLKSLPKQGLPTLHSQPQKKFLVIMYY